MTPLYLRCSKRLALSAMFDHQNVLSLRAHVEGLVEPLTALTALVCGVANGTGPFMFLRNRAMPILDGAVAIGSSICLLASVAPTLSGYLYKPED